MAQATSYNLLNDPHGVRQDIKDIVRRVEPEKTPMYSLFHRQMHQKQLW